VAGFGRPLTRDLGDTGVVSPKDIDEFVNFVRRVQVSYYEEARTRFENEDLLRDLADSNELSPYLSKNLKGIIQKYSRYE
jgi:hypothetical protein